MANIYVRSTDGSDADSGSTWALAKASIGGAAAIDAAGDDIHIASTHSETVSATTTWALAGTPANPVRVRSVSDAAEPPTTLTAGATLQLNGAFNFACQGSCIVEGVTLNIGNGANFANLSINNVGSHYQRWVNCTLNLADTHPSSGMGAGSPTAGEYTHTEFVNCTFKFNSSTGGLGLNGRVVIQGGGFAAGTSSPSSTRGVFSTGAVSRDGGLLVDGMDFSNLAAATHLIFSNTSAFRAVIRNCKLPASWTGSLMQAAITNPLSRASMYDCSGIKLWIEDQRGSIRDEGTIVPSGSTVGYSWKMVSSANANEYAGPLASDEIVIPVETGLGSPKTVTVEIVRDSATALTDAEIWAEVTFKGTSGQTISTTSTDRRASSLATAAAQAASTKVWTTTGLASPNRQKLEVTFTPQVAGFAHVRVLLAKPSTTVYVDPEAVVA